MKNSHRIWKIIWSWLIIALGNVGMAAAVQFFIVPNGLMTAGVVGVGLFLQNFLPVRLSLISLILNVVLFLLGLVLLGKKFAITTLFSTVFYPVALGVLEWLFPNVILTENTLLSVLYAGLLMGFSLGIVLREGASTGGMDIPALLLHKYTSTPLSVWVWVVDFSTLLLQIYHNTMEAFLYGTLIVLLSSLVIDKVIVVGTKKAEVKIISQKFEEIKSAILDETDRGVTVLYGETGYLQNEINVLLSVMSNREIAKLRRIVEEIDEAAFLTITEVSEVRGRGFTLDKDYQLPKTEK